MPDNPTILKDLNTIPDTYKQTKEGNLPKSFWVIIKKINFIKNLSNKHICFKKVFENIF